MRTPRPPGSSPHTRGVRGQQKALAGNQRIIPAYAGSTGTSSPSPPGRPDHPRIRGEHTPTPRSCCGPGGSSPHTRGALGRNRALRRRRRIIPAYAGSTSRKSPERSSRRDHPRIRGEHGDEAGEGAVGPGSSPHTRGAPARIPGGAGLRRIIPAYAGSTLDPDRSGVGDWDHPRIRGEHFPEPSFDVGQAGSSPHTRGAHRVREHHQREARIIPAYAGSTCRRCRLPRRGRDHPRIRGEHVGIGQPGALDRGIIPAYAGSTLIDRAREKNVTGSSPHTRGAL